VWEGPKGVFILVACCSVPSGGQPGAARDLDRGRERMQRSPCGVPGILIMGPSQVRRGLACALKKRWT